MSEQDHTIGSEPVITGDRETHPMDQPFEQTTPEPVERPPMPDDVEQVFGPERHKIGGDVPIDEFGELPEPPPMPARGTGDEQEIIRLPDRNGNYSVLARERRGHDFCLFPRAGREFEKLKDFRRILVRNAYDTGDAIAAACAELRVDPAFITFGIVKLGDDATTPANR